jgi:hypothetical protein
VTRRVASPGPVSGAAPTFVIASSENPKEGSGTGTSIRYALDERCAAKVAAVRVSVRPSQRKSRKAKPGSGSGQPPGTKSLRAATTSPASSSASSRGVRRAEAASGAISGLDIAAEQHVLPEGQEPESLIQAKGSALDWPHQPQGSLVRSPRPEGHAACSRSAPRRCHAFGANVERRYSRTRRPVGRCPRQFP